MTFNTFRWRCLVAVAALAATLIPAVAQEQAPGRHFLWHVTAPSGATAWLLGSVHVLTERYYPLSPVIENAFSTSRTLVEEVDLDEMDNPATMMALASKAMLPSGQTLDRLVSRETFDAVRLRAEQHGVPLMLLQRMKPWMAAVTLTTAELTRAGFDSELGIDRYFFNRAKDAGMPRRALETVAYQFDRLDGLTPALQEASLGAMLADIDTQAANVERIANAWRDGNVATLEDLLFEGFREAPELAERLLYERNRNWVPHVERCLSEDAGCFIVVGAAHLAGPDSLVQLLRNRKFTVVQH